MTKIDRIRCFMTRVDDRPRLLVSITTTDGLTGWGEAYNQGPTLRLRRSSTGWRTSLRARMRRG